MTDALNKKIAELETQIQRLNQSGSGIPVTVSPVPPVTTPGPSYATVKPPDEPRHWRQTVECYGCGAPGHLKRECRERGPGNRPKKTDSLPTARPIHAEDSRTFMTVRFKKYRTSVLLDTGSDVTLVNRQVARKYKWQVEPCELQSIAACNGEKLLIDGVTRTRLNCNGKEVATTLYVSPDISGVILGIDWLTKPGNVWDFGEKRIRIGDGEWIHLRSHPTDTCSRIYVEEDVLLAPRQETTVNARMTWRRPRDMPAMGMNETVKIPNLCRVYSGRNLLPVRHTDLKVRVLNADSKEQIGPTEEGYQPWTRINRQYGGS